MLQGKVNAALKFLADSSDQGVLPVSDEVLNDLKMKHPALSNSAEHFTEWPIRARKASKITNGAAGPSQLM